MFNACLCIFRGTSGHCPGKMVPSTALWLSLLSSPCPLPWGSAGGPEAQLLPHINGPGVLPWAPVVPPHPALAFGLNLLKSLSLTLLPAPHWPQPVEGGQSLPHKRRVFAHEALVTSFREGKPFTQQNKSQGCHVKLLRLSLLPVPPLFHLFMRYC